MVCGQNCTFVVQASGTVLACGEGCYGRLGQGNSDDLQVLTPITALQGTASFKYWYLIVIMREDNSSYLYIYMDL